MSLGRLLTTNKISKLENPAFFGRKADSFSIHPDEIIVGRMPPCFSLGLGKAVMPYLHEDEKMPAFFKGLSEAAGMGHVIPDYETLLQKGVTLTLLSCVLGLLLRSSKMWFCQLTSSVNSQQ